MGERFDQGSVLSRAAREDPRQLEALPEVLL
jgi:hypothetical protein